MDHVQSKLHKKNESNKPYAPNHYLGRKQTKRLEKKKKRNIRTVQTKLQQKKKKNLTN
jgi:hypothetical protein